ncbi:UNVERIFIED_CONTAM: hypothetical protein RMT77_018812 [Armadillidium vulgare]
MRFVSLLTLLLKIFTMALALQEPTLRGGRRFSPNFCRLAIARGICYSHHVRFGYFKEGRRCVQFDYSGCDGNKNNFRTMSECVKTCM